MRVYINNSAFSFTLLEEEERLYDRRGHEVKREQELLDPQGCSV